MKRNLGKTFSLLWMAQSASSVGSQISQVAIPLFAVANLHFSALQLGFLLSLEGLPTVLFGLISGVLVDRMPRKQLLVVCDLIRFLVMLLAPVLYWAGLLNSWVLYAIALIVSSLSVFFDTAFWSFLPTVITRDELAYGNSRLSMTQSVAETVGPSVAGVIMSLVGPPGTLVLDALSYLWSFFMISSVPRAESEHLVQGAQDSFFAALKSGLAFVLTNRVLVLVALGGVIWHVAYFALMPGLYIWLQKDLAVPSAQIGLILSFVGIGAVVSAPFVPMLQRLFGPIALLATTQLLAVASMLLIPLAKSHTLADTAFLCAGLAVMGGSSTIASILQLTLRQEVTPEVFLGRMTSAIRLIVWGAIPVGSLVGGALFGALPRIAAFNIVGLTGVAATLIWSVVLFVRPLNLAYSAD